jgi:hypothetical protein
VAACHAGTVLRGAAGRPAPRDGEVRDIRLSPDGRQLAYLLRASGDFELHVRELDGDRDTIVASEEAPDPSIALRGWTSTGSLLLLRRRPGPGGSRDLTAIETTLDGRRRDIATLADAFITTARLDSPRRRLLVTRAEGGIHNIYALTLADSRLERLTDNQLPGVSFAGIEPAQNGAVLFSRAEWRRDVWIARNAGR